MPSHEPVPRLEEFLDAFHAETASRFENADSHRGAIYDHGAGMGALLFQRQAQHDRDEARALYFDTAEGSRLDAYIERRYDRERVLDKKGVGTAHLRRPSGAAGAGTIYAGTRIAIAGDAADIPRFFRVRTDRPVGASETDIPDLEIEADVPGPDGSVSGTPETPLVMRFEDLLWDNTFEFLAIDCAAGTLRERDPDYRANTKTERLNARPGYTTFIVEAMKAAGAEVVVLFPSNYLGNDADVYLNFVYVGDASFQTSAALLEACRFALPAAGMGGAALQVLPMTQQSLDVAVSIQFWDLPDRFDRQQAELNARSAVVGYFAARENPYTWKAAAIRSAVTKAVRNVHEVVVTASAPEPSLQTVFQSLLLVRYRVENWNVTVQLVGPA